MESKPVDWEHKEWDTLDSLSTLHKAQSYTLIYPFSHYRKFRDAYQPIMNLDRRRKPPKPRENIQTQGGGRNHIPDLRDVRQTC